MRHYSIEHIIPTREAWRAMREAPSKFHGPEGVALARETIDILSGQDIPTSPANYEVWTAHRLGANPDLSREIETRLASGERFTDEANEDLFERYFANTRLSVQVVEASESITRELTEAVATLRDAGDQSGTYANELRSAASTFDGDIDPAGFRILVAKLSAAAREMAEKNLQLSKQMEASSRQVETLQATLQSVKVQALTDGLTGLANRKCFDETLRRRMQEVAADAGDLCLLLCDIDHFKSFNDTWGHLVGDQVIRFVANTLRQHAVGDFLAARYGGEEFALIMPRTRLAEAQTVAAAVHGAVRSKRLTRRSTGESMGAVTLSLGLALCRKRESANELIARADACLYASKRAGRDRITCDAEFGQVTAA